VTSSTRFSGPGSGEVIVHVVGRTDVGRTREHNEDAFLIVDLSADDVSLQPEARTHRVGALGTLFMVADGLGGAAAGEIASQLAVETVLSEMRSRWRGTSSIDPESFAVTLQSAAEAANSRIFAYALAHPEHRGLGTTATIAGLLHDTLYIAQVGDSRAYLVRGGESQQLTRDQSLMQHLVEAGELTPEEAEQSERRNIILQALGPEPAVKIDLTFQRVSRADTLVLCTDGLSGLVKKDEIAQVMTQTPDLSVACEQLIALANERGGPDNVTVVAVRFDGAGLPEPNTDDPVGHAVFRPRGGPGGTIPLPGYDTPRTVPLLDPDGRAGGHMPRARTPAAERTSRAVLIAVIATIVLAGLVVLARELGSTPAPTPATPPPRSSPALHHSH
jgi:protein phosphatase